MTCVQLFNKSIRGDGFRWLPPRYYPLLLFISFFIAAVYPWSQRKGLWYSVGAVLLSPFSEAKFRCTFLADVMTSLTKVTNDITYTFCYFGTGQWKDLVIESCSSRWQMTKVVAPLFYTIPMVR